MITGSYYRFDELEGDCRKSGMGELMGVINPFHIKGVNEEEHYNIRVVRWSGTGEKPYKVLVKSSNCKSISFSDNMKIS